MQTIPNFVYFFCVFPFMILRAAIFNGVFGRRSIEDWLIAVVVWLLCIIAIPSFFTFSLIAGSLCWAWCILIWFAYRIDDDRGYYRFSSDIKQHVESRLGEIGADGFDSLKKRKYIFWTYLSWHLSLAGAVLYLGIKVILVFGMMSR